MSSPRLQAHMAHGGDSEHDVVKTDHMVSEASHACKGVMFFNGSVSQYLLDPFFSTTDANDQCQIL